MKRIYYAIVLCAALLVFEATVFLPSSKAKEDVVAGLLQVPAPPPPNPLMPPSVTRAADFYNKSKPPKGNAPIDELMEYWARTSGSYQYLLYNPEPDEKSLDRLIGEIDKSPSRLPEYLNILPQGEKAAEFVKRLYDRESASGIYDRGTRRTIKDWLTLHSPYFTNDLYKMAAGAGDTDSYVSNHHELLALTRVDFDRAKPLIDRLQASGSQKASRALAAWALYRHAVDTDSVGDIDRYRDELKSIVENKDLGGPMRDLAMDALVSEKEWPGRDEWYMSLLGDETLSSIAGYTGLTTLITISPEEKYIDKMVELLKSNNPTVRANAIRNLLTRIGSKNPEVIRAMLPWLEDPKWATESNDERSSLVNALVTVRLPESVPGLIRILDEKGKRPYSAANTMANMAMANIAPAGRPTRYPAVNSNSSTTVKEETFYPYRSRAISALAAQADPAAGPNLRRILPEVETYEQSTVVMAILSCKGFSIPEQVDALESRVKELTELGAHPTEANLIRSNTFLKYSSVDDSQAIEKMPISALKIKTLLGTILMQSGATSEEFASAVVDRIGVLDEKDPKLSELLREIVLKWQSAAVNKMLLADVKRDRSTVGAIVRLLSQRKYLHETQPSDVSDLRTGTPTSIGIAACLLEDAADYTAILDAENTESKVALLACGRLIRAPLPLPKVAEFIKSGDRRLAIAAERYLESEDSSGSRSIVLSLHPNEAKILGATTAFYVDEGVVSAGQFLNDLLHSVAPDGNPEMGYTAFDSAEFKANEENLRKEVKEDKGLLGIYSFDGNFIRIYGDRAMFSWDYDGSRYRERELSKFEFDDLKAYLTENHVDELVPFLQCPVEGYCAGKELLMLGRNGGRRVYVAATPLPAFFVGLNKYFTDLKASQGTAKYALSREIRGLEILLSNDDLHAETVWKDGNDLRVAVTDKVARKKIAEEIDRAAEESEGKTVDAEGEVDDGAAETVRTKLTDKRAFEGYSWRKIVHSNDAGTVAQPPQFDLIPARDALDVQPSSEQWKARVAGVEIRSGSDGLFKTANGKLTKLQSGLFENPVMTPNGKWVFAHHTATGENGVDGLVRINLSTNKVFQIDTNENGNYAPMAYVPNLNKVLVVEQGGGYGIDGEIEREADDTVAADREPTEMLLVDADTGATQPVSGEFRPLTQQTFRALQKASKPNEFWAAIPDREDGSTQVGIFDINHFGFKPIVKIPKILFNSMSMWVDEPGNKVYFVYRGQLLALPLLSAAKK